MEFKLFTEPQFHDEKWYVDREAADHIHQEGGHRMRLLEALGLIEHIVLYDDLELETLADWGAGNGGLLSEIRTKPWGLNLKTWGYDLCPANVQWGKEKYGLQMDLMNVVTGEPKRGEIVVLTEFLEHLVDPHRIVNQLLEAPPLGECRWVVASSPGFEDPNNHYEYHLFAWTVDSFARMFERAGWIVRRHYHYHFCGTQFLVAMNPELL